MEQILRGIVASNHPENVKKSLIQQFVLKTSNKVAEDDSRAIFEIATEWMTEGKSEFLSETGKLVLTLWAKGQKDAFQKNFTEAFLLSFLAEREQISVNILNYLRISFDHMQHTSEVFSLYKVVSNRIHGWVQQNTTTDFGAVVARLLIKFEHCWPVGENLLQFNLSLIQALSKTQLPKTSKQEMTSCIQNGAVIGALLNKMWGKNQVLVFPVLTEIFKTISLVEPNPSAALASVVQYFPSDVIQNATSLVASNPSVTDENLTLALSHMINWLSWPVGKKVDQWIVGFLNALAFAEKHSILITVTQAKVAQVFSRLFFPVVRESTMVVLSHMLLSFQHSPQAFHEIVEHVPALVKNLKKENSASSHSTLQTLAELIHCLMYQHTGFPELYGPVLDCLQDLPKPSEVMMKKWLTQSAWSAQCDKIQLAGLTPKSATGKTGLVNLGNTCYMNCVLQALYMLDQFRSVTFQQQTLASQQPLLYHLQEVFAFLTLSQRTAFAPSKFLHIARPPWFAAGTQQDCSEFLKFLLDRTSQEDKLLNDSNKKPHKTSLVDESFSGKLLVCYRCCRCNSSSCREEVFTDLPLAFPQSEHLEDRSVPNEEHDSIDLTKQPVKNANVTVSTTVAPERSLKGGDIAQDLSSTSVTSSDEVDNRAASTSSHEAASKVSSLPSGMQEWGLRADVRTDITVSELLEYFFEPETLQGSNQYYCEECQSLQDAERSVAISKSSDILVLTLKRFAYNIRTQQRSKILQCVSYPLILKLPSAHLKGSVMVNIHSSDELVNCEVYAREDIYDGDHSRFSPKRTKQESEDSTNDFRYALCSVIVHSGTSSESGHYYCYARSSVGLTSEDHEETTASSSKWYLFNDSRVTYSSYNSFAHVSKRFPKDTPYVLIYKKVWTCATAGQESNRPDGQSNVMPGAEIRKELVDIVNKDNLLFLQECERQAVNMAKQKSWSNTYHPPDDDDDDDNKGPPGSCGSGPGVTMPFNRFVF